MLFTPLVWALLTFTLMVALPGALAAPSPKKLLRKNSPSRPLKLETYPAMEDGEMMERYELVPPAKRTEVLKRMQLCQQLFVASGRAYDYRSMTTAALEKEVATLNAAKKHSITLRQDPSGRFSAVEVTNPADKDPILDAE